MRVLRSEFETEVGERGWTVILNDLLIRPAYHFQAGIEKFPTEATVSSG